MLPEMPIAANNATKAGVTHPSIEITKPIIPAANKRVRAMASPPFSRRKKSAALSPGNRASEV